MSMSLPAPFQVVESNCLAKTPNTLGDDLVVVTKQFAAVIDGASSWSGLLDGKSPGRFAAEAIADALHALPAQATLPEAAQILSERLARALSMAESEGTLLRPATCVAAIYSATRREVWLVGDCQALVGGQHYQHELVVDVRVASLRQAFLRAQLLKGVSAQELQVNDPTWPMLKPLLEVASAFQNHPLDPLGYSAFDGQEIPAQHLHIIAVPPEVSEVILASDGYPVLHSSLDATEAALQELRKNDPLMIDIKLGNRPFPTHKGSFDDRSYLKLQLE